MEEKQKSKLKTQCDTIGMAMRVLFWLYSLFLLYTVIKGIWTLINFEELWRVWLEENTSSSFHLVFMGIGMQWDLSALPIHFSESAMAHPTAVYLIGFIGSLAVRLLTAGILWNIRGIFIGIDRERTPFVKKSCRSVFRIGIALILIGLIKYSVIPFIYVLAGLGQTSDGSLISVDITTLLTGGIFICLSYIFEYGTSLQKESDELI